MNTLKKLITTAAVASLAGTAFGGDKIEADIDKLKAELRAGGDQWHVDVRAEIEVETREFLEELALVLTVREYGRELTQADGQPLNVVIPLTTPTEIDGEDLEFEHVFSFPIAAAQVTRPHELELIGEVFVDPKTPAIERKQTDIDWDGPDLRRVERVVAPSRQEPVYTEPVYTEPAYNEPVTETYTQSSVEYVPPQTTVVQSYVEPVSVVDQYVTPVYVQDYPTYCETRPSINFGFAIGSGFRNYYDRHHYYKRYHHGNRYHHVAHWLKNRPSIYRSHSIRRHAPRAYRSPARSIRSISIRKR